MASTQTADTQLQTVSATCQTVSFVHTKGRDRDTYWHFRYQHIDILISQQHEDREILLEKTVMMLNEMHPKLLPLLRTVNMPYDTLDGREPGPLRTIPASAYGPTGLMIIWGRHHQENGYPAFSTLIFEHELAHMIAKDPEYAYTNGPPPELLADWQTAMRADADHHRLHAQQSDVIVPQPFIQLAKIQGNLHRLFGLGSEFIDDKTMRDQVERNKGVVEDWASSMSFLLLQQRQGYVWQGEYDGQQQTLDFQEWWPHRTEILEKWLTA